MPLAEALRRALFGCALLILAPPALAAEPVFPPGSAVGLVPPPGMSVSERFAGFEDRAREASIVFLEMPAEAYQEVQGGFTAEGLRATGVVVSDRRELAVPGGRAILVRGGQKIGATIFAKWIILAGAPSRTALVTAQVPEAARGIYTDEAVEAALRTLAFRPAPPIAERLAALPFTIRDMAGFRVMQVLAGSAVLLTAGPKDYDPDGVQPSVIVASGVEGAVPGTERGSFALNALRSLAQIREVRVVGQRGFEAGGAAWDEIAAEAVDAATGVPLRVLQIVRFGPGNTLRILARMRADQPSATPDQIRQLARSVVPR